MSDVAGVFLDTNILVYARDRSEPSKGPFAERLLEDVTFLNPFAPDFARSDIFGP